MSSCTFYEVIPDDMLYQIAADDGLVEVLERIWCVVGIYRVFDVLDAEELAEITEDLPETNVSKMREILSAAKAFPHVNLEGSYELHQSGFTKTLLSLGVADAETVFNHLFNGEKQWLPNNTSFGVVTSSRCLALYDILKKVEPSIATQHYDFSGYETPAFWVESVQSELAWLIECYQHAAHHRASVVIGWG